MNFIREFSGLSKKDADIAGGKGASLGEMLNAGIPVPDGFVVLSTTFDEFIEQADLTAEIETILERVDHKAIHTVDEASEKIQLLIKETAMPKPIATEVLSSFKELGSLFVAVRSSATAEDGADHAWAGQLDSYLNTTETTLLTRVQECWASLFTPRAIFYRFEKGLHDTHISVAVVVQKMVNSEVSGIAFSVHPVTEDRNQLIIEAGFGLGEAIVSGSITPDSYVVEKEPRKILDINVSTQERKLIRKEEGGNEWTTISEPEASSQVLAEDQIKELSNIILEIEKHFGFPCDIEWAYETGKFYIVQSRPITTLSNIPVSKIVSYKKGDYVLTFWAKGVSPLVTDISREGYAELEVLYIIDNGTFKQYFPKKAYERALDEGLEFYKNVHLVEAYQQALNDHIKGFEDFFLSNIKDKQTISENDVVEFFKYAVHLSREYLKMGFEYTDKAFAHQDENDVIKKNLAIVSKYKDEIREFVNRVFFNSEEFLLSLLKILSAQFSLPLSTLENLTQQELLGLFNGNQYNSDKLQNRRKAFVCIYDNSSPIEGPEAVLIVNQFTESVSEANEIKGQTASKGKISGKVKIIPVDYSNFIRVNNEIEKMNQGDILVAETTAPELIVACKKAGAIVTDMGGLMSHAAIVSREFGIPCIVGTGNASKILEDGDRVEVDANNGIVRVLK